MSEERAVRRQIVVDTTPELAFEAWARASELREWMSDEAWTEAKPGGRFEVRWNSGYRAEGKFAAIEAPRRAAFTWQGTGEPGQTQIEVAVEPVQNGVQVTLVHSGFGPGPEWDKALSEAQDGWTSGLENLKSVLETGVDLRWARRPFLGILLDTLDAERAAKEGIAVDAGIYINDTVEGSGARAAGLVKGDVVTRIGAIDTPGFQELVNALGACQAGDQVPVDVVRGQQRLTIEVTLGQRPQYDTPASAEALAQALADRCAEVNTALEAALEGVSDEEASQRPAEGEWSVKEVLAHLSAVERDQHCYLAIFSLDGWLDTGPGNTTALPGRIAAVLAATPSLEGMLERFTTDEVETVAFLQRLPEEALVHKARFRRIAQQVLGLPDHTREHIEQIKKTLAAVRAR